METKNTGFVYYTMLSGLFPTTKPVPPRYPAAAPLVAAVYAASFMQGTTKLPGVTYPTGRPAVMLTVTVLG